MKNSKLRREERAEPKQRAVNKSLYYSRMYDIFYKYKLHKIFIFYTRNVRPSAMEPLTVQSRRVSHRDVDQPTWDGRQRKNSFLFYSCWGPKTRTQNLQITKLHQRAMEAKTVELSLKSAHNNTSKRKRYESYNFLITFACMGFTFVHQFDTSRCDENNSDSPLKLKAIL